MATPMKNILAELTESYPRIAGEMAIVGGRLWHRPPAQPGIEWLIAEVDGDGDAVWRWDAHGDNVMGFYDLPADGYAWALLVDRIRDGYPRSGPAGVCLSADLLACHPRAVRFAVKSARTDALVADGVLLHHDEDQLALVMRDVGGWGDTYMVRMLAPAPVLAGSKRGRGNADDRGTDHRNCLLR